MNIFLLSKSEHYYYDYEAIKEPAVYGHTPTGVGFGHGTDAESRNRKRIQVCSFSRKVNEDVPPGQPKQHREERENISYAGTRNRRTVWNINTCPSPKAHFATFSPEIPKTCILAGCPEGGVVLDPFAGSGTTLRAAVLLGRNAIGIDISEKYCNMTEETMATIEGSLFEDVSRKSVIREFFDVI